MHAVRASETSFGDSCVGIASSGDIQNFLNRGPGIIGRYTTVESTSLNSSNRHDMEVKFGRKAFEGSFSQPREMQRCPISAMVVAEIDA